MKHSRNSHHNGECHCIQPANNTKSGLLEYHLVRLELHGLSVITTIVDATFGCNFRSGFCQRSVQLRFWEGRKGNSQSRKVMNNGGKKD